MKSLGERSGRAGLLRLRTSLKWRLLEPAEDACLGVTSMKAEYPADMEACTAASRQALRDLDFVITGGELHTSEARIDARSDLAELVQITLASPTEDGKTRVTFFAGRDWSNDDKELIRKLQDAFERRLKNPAGNQS